MTIRIVPVLLLISLGSCAHTQPVPYLGTKTPYRPLQRQYKQAPAGYKPVFINYVGRHGARFMTKAGSDVLLLDVLQQGAAQHALTPAGEQVLEALSQFEQVEKSNYENITLLGEEEQEGIAKRMFSRFGEAFKQRGLPVIMTTKVRTQQSAKAFLKGITDYPADKIPRTIGADSTLRFYDLSPAYDAYVQSKTVHAHLDSLTADPKMAKTAAAICNRIFKADFIKKLDAKAVSAAGAQGNKKPLTNIDLATALYDVYTISHSAAREIDREFGKPKGNIGAAFSSADLQWLDLLNGAEDFYEKGPADDTLGIQVTIAAPLLTDFIKTTDSVLAGTTQADAILRFTHAEAISPFATLLGIPQAAMPSQSVYTYQKKWQVSQVIPLSANIQWVLYTNGSSHLLEVMLNEQDVALPVPTATFPFYNWDDVKAYYLAKLQKLQP